MLLSTLSLKMNVLERIPIAFLAIDLVDLA